MSATTLLAAQRLIDSVWTVAYQIVGEGKVKILSHSRENPEGYKRERELPRFGKVENPEGRIFTHLRIQNVPDPWSNWADKDNSTTYEVVNPQNVFSYDEVPKVPETAVSGTVDGIPCGGVA
jgi:hypothetical protein